MVDAQEAAGGGLDLLQVLPQVVQGSGQQFVHGIDKDVFDSINSYTDALAALDFGAIARNGYDVGRTVGALIGLVDEFHAGDLMLSDVADLTDTEYETLVLGAFKLYKVTPPAEGGIGEAVVSEHNPPLALKARLRRARAICRDRLNVPTATAAPATAAASGQRVVTSKLPWGTEHV